MEVRESTAKQFVDPGLKKTDFGMVPIDWLDRSVGELIQFEGGSQPDKSFFRHSSKSGYVRLIQIRDYKTDKYETYVPKHLARRFCSEQDIMIGRYGPPVFQILRGIAGAYNVALIKAKPTSEIDVSYAYYFLKQEKLFEFIEKLSQRSSGQTGVDLKELRQYPLPLPPTKIEQESIANALSDADALIESLEQLITKKRHIKQGAMQELLTCNKRLSGFNGKWAIKKLGDLAEIKDGTHQTPKYFESGVPFFSVENVTNGDFRNTKFISETEHQFLTRSFKIEKGDILMTRIGSIGDCKLIDWDANASFYVSLALLKIRKGTSAAFICHYSKSAYFKKQIELNSLQSAIPKKINLGPISEVKVEIPADLDEQIAIATVLSDMDAEIVALEQKLTKARQIKQGMMHNLLTGKIRLV